MFDRLKSAVKSHFGLGDVYRMENLMLLALLILFGSIGKDILALKMIFFYINSVTILSIPLFFNLCDSLKCYNWKEKEERASSPLQFCIRQFFLKYFH